MSEALRRAADRIPLAAAATAAAMAMVEIVRGWTGGGGGGAAAERLDAMVPVTACGVLICAFALLLLRPRRSRQAQRVGLVLGALAAGLGGVVVLMFAGEWTGIADLTSGAPGRWLTRRPGLTTGLGFAFLGASLLALGSDRPRIRRWAAPSATGTLMIGLTTLVGHAYGTGWLQEPSRWGGTTVSAGLALCALAAGVLFADPSRGVAAVAVSDSSGGHLIRRLTPAALFAPILAGWLALQGFERGFADAPFAAAGMVVVLILLLLALIARQAVALHAVDAERERLFGREREVHGKVTRILESITDAFFAVDRDWRFTYVNREAERLLQRPRDELLGQCLWDEFTGAIGSTFEAEYRRAMAGQTTVRFEAYYTPLSAWFDVKAFPTEEGLSVYFGNVTDRKMAEQKLRDSEERFRLLADMVPQQIWVTTADGYHTYFSRRWYEFTGANPDQTQGQGWTDLLHPEDRERTLERWQHSLRTGERYSIEYRFRSARGEYCWFWGQAIPHRDETGQIVEWFGTLTDISERKSHEEERERMMARVQEALTEAERRREELERVTESRTRLMRGFSHDVKNPLGAADGYAQLLEDGLFGDLSQKQRDSIQRIRRSIHTALRLIEDLLELARAETGQLEIERVETEVAPIVREAAEEFRAQAAAVGLEIGVEAANGLQVATDPARVRQILSNLLSNAVKYAPHGRATVTAELLANGAAPGPGTWVALRVADSGQGIPPEKQEHIFQEFTRLEPASPSGAGVGLAISRRIAQVLGGDLTVDSEPGRGSTFTLWLPKNGPG